jgi:hypothetical protein
MCVLVQFFNVYLTQGSAEVIKLGKQEEALGNLLDIMITDTSLAVIDTLASSAILCQKFSLSVVKVLLAASVAYLTAEALTAQLITVSVRQLTTAERNETRSMHHAAQEWQTVTFSIKFTLEEYKFAQAVA